MARSTASTSNMSDTSDTTPDTAPTTGAEAVKPKRTRKRVESTDTSTPDTSTPVIPVTRAPRTRKKAVKSDTEDAPAVLATESANPADSTDVVNDTEEKTETVAAPQERVIRHRSVNPYSRCEGQLFFQRRIPNRQSIQTALAKWKLTGWDIHFCSICRARVDIPVKEEQG